LSRFGTTCTRASLAAIFVACVFATGAWAGGPGDVYNDFAADGKLSCNHSRADLEAVLGSGSLNQYGDPLTLERLKLAVRKQLAGGCRQTSRANPGTNTSSGGGTSKGQTPGSTKKGAKHRRHSSPRSPAPRRATEKSILRGGAGNASFFAGRGLIIGLLVAALALGGWLTKRALATRD
jgi:hypothetical protein